MDIKTLKIIAAIALSLLLMVVIGCNNNGESKLVTIDVTNLGQITGAFDYAAWAQHDNDVGLIDTFNTDSAGNAHLNRFSPVGPLESGDHVFITIEPTGSSKPLTPTGPRVLDGTISGSTEVLSFPKLQQYTNASGTATVSASHTQLVTNFTNLPDVSDIHFIYQGFLKIGNTFTPLKKFNANEVPVTDTVSFDVTTANYILSVEPVPDFDPNHPYTIQPFFTNGNLVELINEPLVKSSLTPGTNNFRFPSGTVTIGD